VALSGILVGVEMDWIVLAAGTALVGAMATDAWQQVHAAVVAVWHRIRPEAAGRVGTELESMRAQVLAARKAADEDTEQALVATWRLRLQQLLDQDPAAAAELRRLLDEHLTPTLAPNEQEVVRSIVQKATASGSSQIIQAGGNVTVQHTPRP
jgi:hypothetical protein